MVQESCDLCRDFDSLILFQHHPGQLTLVRPVGNPFILVQVVGEVDDLTQGFRLFHPEHCGEHVLFRLCQISDPSGQETQFLAIFLFFKGKSFEPSFQVGDGRPRLLNQYRCLRPGIPKLRKSLIHLLIGGRQRQADGPDRVPSDIQFQHFFSGPLPFLSSFSAMIPIPCRLIRMPVKITCRSRSPISSGSPSSDKDSPGLPPHISFTAHNRA